MKPYAIVKEGVSTLKKFPDTAIVTLSEFVDVERTPESDRELQALVDEKQVTLFDLSGTKTIETSWLRLITTLTVNAMRTKGGKIVGVIGANADARAGWDYIGQLKHI